MNFFLGIEESFSIKAEKNITEFKVNLCIICLNKKLKENVIKESKFEFYQKFIFSFVGKTRYSSLAPSCETGGISFDLFAWRREKVRKIYLGGERREETFSSIILEGELKFLWSKNWDLSKIK